MDNDKYKELIDTATERGRNSAGNQFDGNTKTEVFQDIWNYLKGEYEPMWIESIYPTPLSGEWAGESISELFYGLVDNPSSPTDEELDIYEQAFCEAYWAEIERWVRYMLDKQYLDLDTWKVRN